ncbi:coiled-coil domain-containing protein 90B, mitochondrial isoform X1 [Paralichthys olivaceus]|uniref:coiled-coil domain-containing protein 90B, mitochondrial isoform X1 n=1 Tax=Paralichthys olivaceus TaxID=8255 RepID=UPI0037506888
MNALRRFHLRRFRTWRHFHSTAPSLTFDMRKVELTPLEQRKLTFDSHTMVTELERSGFEKRQAELIVSALVTLTTANMDIVYRDMVTKSHQEIAVQQIVSHLDSIRKDMVILEKSEFANLRSENTKMKRELEHLQNRLKEETQKVRAETKLDINLERSRISDMFTEQEKKLMETTTDIHHKKVDLENDNMEINNKIDLQVASLKTLLESLKLETVIYLRPCSRVSPSLWAFTDCGGEAQTWSWFNKVKVHKHSQLHVLLFIIKYFYMKNLSIFSHYIFSVECRKEYV